MSQRGALSAADHPSTAASLWGLLVPLAFFASACVLAGRHTVHQNAVDAAFLGLLATVVLSGLVFVDRAPHRIVAGAGLVCALALWALPAGGVRGAAICFMLTAALGAAALNGYPTRWDASSQRFFVALAVAGQAIFRPEIWLAASWSWTLASEAILLPAVAGLGAAEIGRARGKSVPLAIVVIVALERGIRPELALALAVYCLFWALLERRSSAIVWAAIATAILLSSSAGLASLIRTEREWHDVAAGLAWIPLLAPSVLQPRSVGLAALLAAIGLAFAALWLLPAEVALLLALPALFDTLTLGTPAGRLQIFWSASLVTGAAVMAGYPWLRPLPVEAVLALLGLDVTWTSALVVVLVFWAIVALLRISDRAGRAAAQPARWLPHAAIATLFAGLALNLLPASSSLLSEPLVLSATRPGHVLAVTGTVRSVFVDSYLSNGVSVAPATPILEIRFTGPGGALRRHVLHSGTETGEWAARRPALRVQAPQPWISWPALDGPYFAQRYRTSKIFEAPIQASRMTLHRLDGLPDELEIAVFQVGVRP